MSESIKEILMRRDGMTEDQAEDLIEEAQTQFQIYLDGGHLEPAYDICMEYFGLEPDYLDELL